MNISNFLNFIIIFSTFLPQINTITYRPNISELDQIYQMNPFFIENCFTCGQTPRDNPNLLRTSRRKKCISIIVNQPHLSTSISRPRTIQQHKQIYFIDQPKILCQEAISIQSTYKNCGHQTLLQSTRGLKINPEKQVQNSNKQIKLAKIIINATGKHHRSKSNYVNQTFVSHDASLNKRIQKKPSFLKGGAKGIINAFSNNKFGNESFCLFNERLISSGKLSDCKETTQFSPGLKISLDQYQSQILEKSDISINNPFTNINWTFDTNKSSNYCNLKLKKLLGKGKYCHVNLCQDKLTGTLYTIKQIFKQNTLVPFYQGNISAYIQAISHISHPNIISFYKYSQNKDKITILQEYSPSTLYEQLLIKKTLTISLVRQYIKDIVNAVVYLHDSNKVHGNLNPHQIGLGLNTCKVRPSLTYMIGHQQECRFIDDIHAIALLAYEMAYGLKYKEENKNPNLKNSLKLPRSNFESFKKSVIIDLTQKNNLELRESFKQLNFFILKLLSMNQNIQLPTNICLGHPFFIELK